MTRLQLALLNEAACQFDGTSLYYAKVYQPRQLKWLIERKLVRVKGNRILATRDGKKINAYQMGKL